MHDPVNYSAIRRGKVPEPETFRRTGIDVHTPVWFAQDILHSVPTIYVE
jgi:hypothetical protein